MGKLMCSAWLAYLNLQCLFLEQDCVKLRVYDGILNHCLSSFSKPEYLCSKLRNLILFPLNNTSAMPPFTFI